MEYYFGEPPEMALAIINDKDVTFGSLGVMFNERVEMRNCVVKGLGIFGVYFFGGLVARNCIFECEIDWQAGGHNRGNPILFEDCEFKEFVDFEDCWFEDSFILKNVVFHKGTNLLGNRNTPVVVSFDKEPQLENVQGDLYVDTFRV